MMKNILFYIRLYSEIICRQLNSLFPLLFSYFSPRTTGYAAREELRLAKKSLFPCHTTYFRIKSIALSVFVVLLSASSCNPKLNGNKPSNQPATAQPPADYKPPTAPVPLENLDKDCYEPVTTKGSIPCPDLYAPICGCDGRNYSNPCQAQRAGIKKWAEGNCE